MLAVRKVNKRLGLYDAAGLLAYSPPDFLLVPHRDALLVLGSELDAGGGIEAIMRFESLWHPKRRVRDAAKHPFDTSNRLP